MTFQFQICHKHQTTQALENPTGTWEAGRWVFESSCGRDHSPRKQRCPNLATFYKGHPWWSRKQSYTNITKWAPSISHSRPWPWNSLHHQKAADRKQERCQAKEGQGSKRWGSKGWGSNGWCRSKRWRGKGWGEEAQEKENSSQV